MAQVQLFPPYSFTYGHAGMDIPSSLYLVVKIFFAPDISKKVFLPVFFLDFSNYSDWDAN